MVILFFGKKKIKFDRLTTTLGFEIRNFDSVDFEIPSLRSLENRRSSSY